MGFHNDDDDGYIYESTSSLSPSNDVCPVSMLHNYLTVDKERLTKEIRNRKNESRQA